jgi:hypothetical protein
MGVSLVNGHFQLVADKSLFLTLKTTTNKCFSASGASTKKLLPFTLLMRFIECTSIEDQEMFLTWCFAL